MCKLWFECYLFFTFFNLKNNMISCEKLILADAIVAKKNLSKFDIEPVAMIDLSAEGYNFELLIKTDLRLKKVFETLIWYFEQCVNSGVAVQPDGHGGFGLFNKRQKKMKPRLEPELYPVGLLEKVPVDLQNRISDLSVMLAASKGGVAENVLLGAVRYASHSCKPNAEFFRGYSCNLPYRCVRLRIIEVIQPGEEITVDYGEQYFASGTIACRCPIKHAMISSKISQSTSFSKEITAINSTVVELSSQDCHATVNSYKVADEILDELPLTSGTLSDSITPTKNCFAPQPVLENSNEKTQEEEAVSSSTANLYDEENCALSAERFFRTNEDSSNFSSAAQFSAECPTDPNQEPESQQMRPLASYAAKTKRKRKIQTTLSVDSAKRIVSFIDQTQKEISEQDFSHEDKNAPSCSEQTKFFTEQSHARAPVVADDPLAPDITNCVDSSISLDLRHSADIGYSPSENNISEEESTDDTNQTRGFHFGNKRLHEKSSISVQNTLISLLAIASKHCCSDELIFDLLKREQIMHGQSSIPKPGFLKKLIPDVFNKYVMKSLHFNNGNLILLYFNYQLQRVVEDNIDEIIKYNDVNKQFLDLVVSNTIIENTLSLKLILNIDGAVVRESCSEESAYPVWVAIANLPPKRRAAFKNIILCSIWYGNSDLVWDEIFNHFVGNKHRTSPILRSAYYLIFR